MEEGRGNIAQPFVVTAATTELSRNLDDYPEGIVLPIDKPYRWTSADVIRKLKYAAIRHFGRKNLKIGHAGTLDPLATGILIVCIGRATKLAQGLMDHDKEYVAGVCFGATTPSYDLEKEIDREFPYGHISEALVREKLAEFVGEQEQVAPLFSAKSIDGVRAYEHARRLYKRRMGQGGEVSGEFAAQSTEIPSEVSDGISNEGLSPDGKAVFDAAAGELIRTAHIRINEVELLSFRPAGEGDIVSKVGADLGCGEASRGVSGLGVVGGSEDINSKGISSDINSEEGGVEKNTGDSQGDIGSCVGEASKGVSGFENASSRIHVATTAGHLPYAEIRLSCSKGTYVRAFARDLGEALASGAHLTSLRRTASGPFTIASAVPLPLALSLLA